MLHSSSTMYHTSKMRGLLACVLAVITVASADPRCPQESDDVVIFPNPYDCSTFYQCYKGEPVLKECAANLHFNAELLVCDWQWAANCVEEPAAPKWFPGNDNITIIKEPAPVCPPPGTEVNATSFVNRYNCSEFWICETGVPFLRTCPPGLIFNTQLGVCDFPWATTCTTIESVVPARASFVPAVKPFKAPRLSEFCNTDGSAPRCPPPTVSGNVTLCPDLTNCSRYWLCDNGLALRRDCPTGLHYSVNTETCDFPWNANCVDPAQLDESVIANKPLVHKPLKAPRISEYCNTDGSAPNCPPPPATGNVTFCPDLTNCSRYWQCDNGLALLKDCPTGLHYSVDTETCDFPWNANCVGPSQLDESVIADKPLVHKPLKAPRVSEFCNTDGSAPSCPPPPATGNVTFCPDLTNCSRYWQCDNGLALLKDCPTGLHYSVDTETCDFPWNAHCEDPAQLDESVIAKNLLVHKPVKAPRISEYCNTDGTAPRCPPPPISGNVTTCPYLTNCSRYWHCANGVATIQDCPPGLHYSANLEICDHIWAANCTEQQLPVNKEVEVEIEVKVEVQSPGPYCVDGGPPNCPPPGVLGNATFCRDTTNCSCYYICDNSGSHYSSCAPGLHFNDALNTCDFPWNANCVVLDVSDDEQNVDPQEMAVNRGILSSIKLGYTKERKLRH